MDDPIEAFRALTDDEKVENFERSSLKRILQQLGWTAGRVRSLELELGPALTMEWFNEQNIIPMRVGAIRCFDYDLMGLVFDPGRRCPLLADLAGVADKIVDPATEVPIGVVFQCLGKRLIATSRQIEPPYLTVIAGRHRLQITTLNGFFRTHYGDANEY